MHLLRHALLQAEASPESMLLGINSTENSLLLLAAWPHMSFVLAGVSPGLETCVGQRWSLHPESIPVPACTPESMESSGASSKMGACHTLQVSKHLADVCEVALERACKAHRWSLPRLPRGAAACTRFPWRTLYRYKHQMSKVAPALAPWARACHDWTPKGRR